MTPDDADVEARKMARLHPNLHKTHHADPQIRVGQANDAPRIAVLASQVWLHTYATEGITNEMAQYVLSELSVERVAASLSDPETGFLVAEQGDFSWDLLP